MNVDLENCEDFIDDEELEGILKDGENPSKEDIQEILKKASNKTRLTKLEAAKLLNVKDDELWKEIYTAAKELKEKIYGNRIVLFAPLYIGNNCTNDCSYCGFAKSNKDTVRMTLSQEELKSEVENLEDMGHKRLIIVYGESPEYDGKRIVQDLETIYGVKKGNGDIRRVNINAAPMDVENFKIVHDHGIGTWQIFQETYHHETYKKVHRSGMKSIYKWRITGLDRAQEAGIDDVGIGALFGLYDYKFEVMGLLAHTEHLEEKFGVGPHTISFPRINDAFGAITDKQYKVSDEQLKQIIAVLRLSVPYTGLILTAREPAELRKEIFALGVSQTDAGTRIEMKGYSNAEKEQQLKKEQFQINDVRSLDEVMQELIGDGYIPSFCTSCYRAGRTGEHFMEFSIPGFIHNYCTPNALITFTEYLEDYASEKTKKMGFELIKKELKKVNGRNNALYNKLIKKLEETQDGTRDLYF